MADNNTARVAERKSTGKVRSIAVLALAEIAAMSLWFVSAAILPDLVAEANLSSGRAAALSSAVQLGFVVGALAVAFLGLADRFDPRTVFAVSALVAASANAALLVSEPGGAVQIALRGITGICLAGIYPVGMKIAVGWGTRDRGFLVGLLVAALTLGSASPHLIALFGGADWRATVMVASGLAMLSAALMLGVGLGPHHARAPKLAPGAIALAWTNRPARLAIAGYLGHMWELYAFWAWVGAMALASYGLVLDDNAGDAARLTAFAAIALGGLACIPAGLLADRLGKARIAQWAMIGSLAAGIATALSFGGPVWLVATCLIVWGVFVIPDSAQFSALVADAVPADVAGSLMTFQTALGFALTAVTVQVVPSLAATFGWPLTILLMTLGPAFGIEAMRRHMKLAETNS